MTRTDPLVTEVRCTVVGATRATNWIFVEVVCGTERVGTGEATLSGEERTVVEKVGALGRRLVGRSPADPWVTRLLRAHPRPDLVSSAAVGGIEQAIEDLRAQLAGRSLAAMLGAAASAGAVIPLYATVNRLMLDDRSPDAFAAAAATAVAAGFRIVKCAPFDGIRRGQALTESGWDLLGQGMARLRAVRREVGPDVTLLVDCHGRFDRRSVEVVLDLVAAVDPGWVESVLPDDDVAGWQRAAGADLVLAAGESLTHVAAFEDLLDGPVSVVMPDVKYAGGIRALHETLAAMGRRGGRCSPHNPSGPVSTLASASVMAAFPQTDWLEYAVEDVPWRSALVGGAEVLDGGALVLSDRPGLGLRLDHRLAAQHEPHPTLRPLGALT